MTVAANPSLTLLELDALLEAGALTISGNPMLPQCLVDEIQERTGACNSCSGNDTTATCD